MMSDVSQPKALGFEFLQSASFLKRKGLSFFWGGPLFTGVDFGTRTGPIDSVFEGTLHDLAHCIDFAMRNRIRQVGRHGLIFRSPWQKWNKVLRCDDGYPQTSQHIHTEARAFAIQAWLMQKIAGCAFITDGEYIEDVHVYTAKKADVSEWIAEQGELIQWMDAYIFNEETKASELSYKERQKEERVQFAKLIEQYYATLEESKITQAITRVGEKVRYNARQSTINSNDYVTRDRELIVAF